MALTLRQYRPEDCEALYRLFYSTVHSINVHDYTPAQLDAWAPEKGDLAAWNRLFLAHNALVAEDNGEIVGFGDMAPSGYLDRLYVHCGHQGKGVATAICDALEAQCQAGRFTAHASITARPFFEARGYWMVKAQQVERRGQTLVNYVMEKAGPQAKPCAKAPATGAMSIESLLARIEARIPANEAGFDFVLDEEIDALTVKIEEGGYGLEAVEPILRMMERHPDLEFGSPGGLTHFMETFNGKGYEALLWDSLNRKPTGHTVWLLNRLINGAEGPAQESYLSLMEAISCMGTAGAAVKSAALEFLEYQRSQKTDEV